MNAAAASWSAVGASCAFLVLALLTSCVTRPLPPPDTAQPGWRLLEGQAVWQPRPAAPELAGDVLLMTHPDGRFVLEFSKTPLTLVRAHRSAQGWQLEIPAEPRRWRGTGTPTSRLLWLHLADALRGTPLPNGLEFRREAGDWQLINHRTGERVAGYWSP